MEVMENGCSLNTKVYKRPTDCGQLLNYLSHVDERYERSLLNTMLNCAFKLSSTWKVFHEECERLKETFSRLCYPDDLVMNWRRSPIHRVKGVWRLTYASIWEARSSNRIVLPFKDQKSANAVRKQLGDRSRKVKVDISPVYTSRKIKDEIKVRKQAAPGESVMPGASF